MCSHGHWFVRTRLDITLNNLSSYKVSPQISRTNDGKCSMFLFVHSAVCLVTSNDSQIMQENTIHLVLSVYNHEVFILHLGSCKMHLLARLELTRVPSSAVKSRCSKYMFIQVIINSFVFIFLVWLDLPVCKNPAATSKIIVAVTVSRRPLQLCSQQTTTLVVAMSFAKQQ